ncbi:hypothetical protein FJQ54_12920 [Sandaracinobacter neustonicus]|uniref:Outer membrane beta-barrel protein n=1 Tax=Sandaracinobacter neustonicus TaxID=1715348 RepID=A0A501XHN7_9SPHN|nr:hypothetical protein [Sandaracinobacter neustonicus]TPE59824.1 hypothetical protein FJQ54_12920 [Sandaracinobacter neustonicus]
MRIEAADRVKGRAAFAGGLLVTLVVASPALAQMQPPTPRQQFNEGAVIDDPQRIYGDDSDSFSPLAIVGSLGLSGYAALATEYSDNVARVGEGRPMSSRFESKSDWIFRPAAGLNFSRALGRNNISGNASIGRSYYARNSNLNSNRFALSGVGDIALGQACNTSLRAAWSRRDTQKDSFEEVVSSQTARTTIGGSVGCSTQAGISVSAGYNRNWVRNDSNDPDVDRSFADVNSQAAVGSVGYRVGLRGQVGVSGNWGKNIYVNQYVNGVQNETEIRTISGFGSYRIGNTLSANASIGKTKLTSNIEGSNGFSGMTWNVGATYAGPRMGGNISMGRGANGGWGGSANYSVSRFFSISASYRANDRLSFATGYSHSQADFYGIAAIPETEVSSRNLNDRVFLGANYALNSMLRFGLDLNHHRRSSTPADYSYKVNSVVFSLQARI